MYEKGNSCLYVQMKLLLNSVPVPPNISYQTFVTNIHGCLKNLY